MTSKEIAQSVGKTERCVQRWAKKLSDKMSSINDKMSLSSPMKPADFDMNETLAIIESGMGKNAALIYAENARKRSSESLNDRVVRLDDLMKLIPQIVAATVGETIRLIGQPPTPLPSKELIATGTPAPTINSRSKINMLVRDYAARSGIDHQEAWNYLYRQYNYTYTTNVQTCAENRRKTKLDYIEEIGHMTHLLGVADKYLT